MANCTCGVGEVFHKPFHAATCPCATEGSDPPISQEQQQIAALQARVRELEARLEVDHEYALDKEAGKLVRVEVPPSERSKFPDGITCRDATIKLQNECIAQLEHELSEICELLGCHRAYIKQTIGDLTERADSVLSLEQQVRDLQKENTRLDHELEYDQKVTIPDLEERLTAVQGELDTTVESHKLTVHKLEQERGQWKARLENRWEEGDGKIEVDVLKYRTLLQERDQLREKLTWSETAWGKDQTTLGQTLKECDQLSAMLDRIAAISEVADRFHAPAEENIADGVESLADDYQQLERDHAASRERVKGAHSTIASFLLAVGRHDTSEPVSALLSKLNMWLRHALEGRVEGELTDAKQV